MDRRTLLAVTLCFLIFLGWQKFYVEPRFHVETSAVNPAQTAPSAPSEMKAATKPNADAALPTAPQRPSQTLPLLTSIGEATLGDRGAFFANWKLKDYRVGLASDAPAVDLKTVTLQSEQMGLAFDQPSLAYITKAQGTLTRTANGAVWSYEDNNIKLTRTFLSSADSPYVDVQINAEFKSEQHPRYAFVSLSSEELADDPEAQDRQLLYWSQQSLERIPMKKTQSLQEVATPVKYIGATNRYFILTAISQGPVEAKALIQPLEHSKTNANLVYPVTGKSVNIPLRIYFGPKELNLLRQVEMTLDHTIDFGWFTLFAYPLLKVLKWLYQFVQNYGVAIIFLTLLLKILTYPLTYKSMKSMKKMAALQPQLQKIREKYKDDREALNREMLTIMRSHGYNPMAGCLPILIQMPVFFALYRVLYSSIELYHAPFGLWIHDLSSRDPFYVTPVLLSLTMFVQQKLTPNTATDPAQAKMMQFMPLIFGAFMLALPSGLTVYMLVNALASIAQQMILNKKLNVAPAR